jgi:hypothetical protein
MEHHMVKKNPTHNDHEAQQMERELYHTPKGLLVH